MPFPFLTTQRLRGACASAAVIAGAVASTPAPAQAQQRCGGAGERSVGEILPNADYDGRFTFARIAYSEGFSNRGFGGRGRQPFWAHDYPDAERHLTKLLSELSASRVRSDASVIVSLSDPKLFRFPVAYLSEPGHWVPNEQEVLGLRAYLRKGGFLIFDDFYGNDIRNLQIQMQRVLPEMRLIELGPDHVIFDAFYRVKALDFYHPYQCIKSQFFGIFEDNDPRKRMYAIVNHNNDLGEMWEFSDLGLFPIDPSNEAYKLGINYIIYALTR